MVYPFPRPFPGPSILKSFSVLSLFSSGEQGAWYDPSDFSTMFQDSAGTTPVTAVEQPVGLILDKSKGLTLGSNLATDSNAIETDANATTGWTSVSVDSFDVQTAITNGSTYAFQVNSNTTKVAAARIYRSMPTLVSGKSYKLSIDARHVGTGSAWSLAVASSNSGTDITVATLTNTNNTWFSYTCVFTASASTSFIVAREASPANDGGLYLDNLTIRELPGNHASQSTAASRPVLSARVNLLTYSEQFDNAIWDKSATSPATAVTANTTTAPNGTVTADKISQPTVINLFQAINNATASVAYKFSCYLKQSGTTTSCELYIFNAGAGGSFVSHASFNFATGLPTNIVGSGATMASVGDGWYLCSVTGAPNRATISVGIYNVPEVFAWGADLRVTNVGVNLPAYQRVGAAVTATTNPAVTGVPDYDTTGFPLYLKFDGTDDSLATGSIDFTATDKMSVFAGVRKLSDAAQGELVNINGADIVSLSVPRSTSITGAAVIMGSAENRGSTVTAPATLVLAAAYDRAALTLDGQVALRSNTVSSSATGTITASGAFGNRVIYIGRRGGSTLPLNAHLFSLIVRGAQSTDATIASTETYVNNLTKAY